MGTSRIAVKSIERFWIQAGWLRSLYEESGDQQHGYDAFRKSLGPSV